MLDKILEFCDAFDLLISGGDVNVCLSFLFSELEDLVSNLIVILSLADFIQKLLMELE